MDFSNPECKVGLEKHFATKIELVSYCPTKDLFAIIQLDTNLILSRLDFDEKDIKKVWENKFDYKITAVAFKPDGNSISVGFINGNVNIVSLETSEIINAFNLKNQITFLFWAEEDNSNTSSNINQVLDYSVFEKHAKSIKSKLPTPSPLPNSSEFSKVGISDSLNTIEESSKTINILLICDSLGNLTFSLYGIFFLGSILIHGLSLDPSRFRIVQSSITSTLKTLSFLTIKKPPDDASKNEYLFQLLSTEFDLKNLLRYKNELKMFSVKSFELNLDLLYLEEGFEICKKEFLNSFTINEKFFSLNKSRWEECGGVGFPMFEYLSLYLTGFPSQQFLSFLVNELGESVTSFLIFVVLTNFVKDTVTLGKIDSDILHNSKKVYFNVSSTRYKKSTTLDFDIKLIFECMTQVETLMILIECLLLYLNEEIKKFSEFSAWLIKAVVLLSGAEHTANENDNQHEFVVEFLRTDCLVETQLKKFFEFSSKKEHLVEINVNFDSNSQKIKVESESISNCLINLRSKVNLFFESSGKCFVDCLIFKSLTPILNDCDTVDLLEKHSLETGIILKGKQSAAISNHRLSFFLEKFLSHCFDFINDKVGFGVIVYITFLENIKYMAISIPIPNHENLEMRNQILVIKTHTQDTEKIEIAILKFQYERFPIFNVVDFKFFGDDIVILFYDNINSSLYVAFVNYLKLSYKSFDHGEKENENFYLTIFMNGLSEFDNPFEFHESQLFKVPNDIFETDEIIDRSNSDKEKYNFKLRLSCNRKKFIISVVSEHRVIILDFDQDNESNNDEDNNEEEILDSHTRYDVNNMDM
ncbi:Anaphase-promoting complex subunit 4 [Clydaea vesicula]|uniref:Anaphase-promoting complex subunit 4 n=1 Tax=Clydaea vesicula TaxID=447962 RepID=A0AAD5TXF1_9FUNG|nr:Anaphase-promoting complex subunit 4 [Clydaea vesicula]